MIGWSKTRKRCSKHGLVLRGRPDSYSNNAEYCPACGKRLVVVSVPYLFQVYFHPAIMIVPGILVFLCGLFMFLDVRGCVIADREANAIAEAKSKELADRLMESMPEQWAIIYSGMASTGYPSTKWNMLRDHLQSKPEDEQMPYLDKDQVRVFLNALNTGRKDDAFALIMKHMEKEE